MWFLCIFLNFDKKKDIEKYIDFLYSIQIWCKIYDKYIFSHQRISNPLTKLCLVKSQDYQGIFMSTESFMKINFFWKMELIDSNKTSEQTNMASLFELQILFRKIINCKRQYYGFQSNIKQTICIKIISKTYITNFWKWKLH